MWINARIAWGCTWRIALFLTLSPFTVFYTFMVYILGKLKFLFIIALLFIGFQSSAFATTIVSDNFSGTNGTLLETYNNAWINRGSPFGNAYLNGAGAVTSDGNASAYFRQFTTTDTIIYLEVQMNLEDPSFISLTDNSESGYAMQRRDGSTMYLRTHTALGDTDIASVAYNGTGSKLWKLQINTATGEIKGYIDGAEIISTTDTTYTNISMAGVWWWHSTNVSNFVVDGTLGATPTPTPTTAPTPTPTPILNPEATNSATWNTFKYQYGYRASNLCVMQGKEEIAQDYYWSVNIPNTYYVDGFTSKALCQTIYGTNNKQMQTKFVGIMGDYLPTPDAFIGQANIKIRLKGFITNMDIKLCTEQASSDPKLTATVSSGCYLLQNVSIDTNNYYDLEYIITPNEYQFQAEQMQLNQQSDITYGITFDMVQQTADQLLYIDSIQIQFITDTGTYYSSNTGGTPEQAQVKIPKLSCGAFQVLCDGLTNTIDFIINSILDLFNPTNISTEKANEIKQTLLDKAPFAYVITALDFNTDPLTATSGAMIWDFSFTVPSTNDQPSKDVPLRFEAPPQFNTYADYFKTFLSINIGLGLLYYFYKLGRRIVQ